MFKLVLADYDGTIAAPGAASVSAFAVEAIHELIDCGVLFGPITGRTPARSHVLFRGDDACCSTGAFVNGQVLYLEGKCVRTVSLPRVELKRLLAFIDRFDDAILTCGRLDEGDSVFITTTPRKAARHMIDSPWYTGELDTLPEGEIVKCGIHVHADEGRVSELIELLRREFLGVNFVRPSFDLPYIDVLPHGWDKEKAVRALCAELNITADEVIVFGDSENDLQMIERLPHSVAVANAYEPVKQRARYHIGSCYEDAVAHALKEIAQAQKTGDLPAFMNN